MKEIEKEIKEKEKEIKEKVEYIVSIVNNYEGESITSNPRH